MDKIFIDKLRLHIILGIREWERTTPQDVLVSVTVLTSTRSAGEDDSLEASVDYSGLEKKIRTLAAAARRFTVEALAEDIARLCLSTPRVERVRVRVEKPDALPDAESVGVEIERPAD
jgi:FolB domain-containing protein